MLAHGHILAHTLSFNSSEHQSPPSALTSHHALDTGHCGGPARCAPAALRSARPACAIQSPTQPMAMHPSPNLSEGTCARRLHASHDTGVRAELRGRGCFVDRRRGRSWVAFANCNHESAISMPSGSSGSTSRLYVPTRTTVPHPRHQRIRQVSGTPPTRRML